MITLATIAISLTVGLLLINFAHGQIYPDNSRSPWDPYSILPLVNGQSENKPRTLMDCYSAVAKNLLYVSMFTPTTINLNDPQMKTYITNYCNFYHEKLGTWIEDKDMPKLGNLTEKDIMMSKEFEQKYQDAIPRSIIDLSNNLNQTLN